MSNPFHLDWLRRFREDLRTGDMDGLTQNVELAGLETLLDPEFMALACQEDARSVVVLVATLGEANSDQPGRYQRHRAAYQYLQGQIGLEEAAQQCSQGAGGPSGYYAALLDSARKHSAIGNIGAFALCADDLQFGIELLINTGHSTEVSTLLKVWQRMDLSDLPWLRICRASVERRQKLHAQNEAASLAATTHYLIEHAPQNQQAVIQEMRVQRADLALKARDGAMACDAAKEAFQHDQSTERRFTLAKALILKGELPTAVQHLHALLLHTLSEGGAANTVQGEDLAPSSFDVLAAEDTLIKVNQLLRAKGLKPFLMSGTLLGYARQGELLPHDKDVDLGLIGWEHQFTVAEALLEAGHFRVDWAQLSGRNRFLMSAHDLRNGMAVDFFLFHDKGDHFLHGIDFDMGFTQNFRFSKFELEEVDFLGERFYVPADIDHNLSENYGDWRTPAPSYVVTVESPALCDSIESRTLLVYLEVLKTLTKGMKPQRVVRILDHLDATQAPFLSADVKQLLRTWCSHRLVQQEAPKEVLA